MSVIPIYILQIVATNLEHIKLQLATLFPTTFTWRSKTRTFLVSALPVQPIKELLLEALSRQDVAKMPGERYVKQT